MTMAVEEGLVSGSNVIQYGMATPVFGEGDWDQVLAEGGKVYHIHEIRRMVSKQLSKRSTRTWPTSTWSMSPSTLTRST